ncbi:MAG: hypothetical protein H6755_03355 [Candidatus Omnitrophica bacterium]|nr:hypothetical protein [Candidatus Omnitrophota bacterium]MCB9747424.1 hypothetical protein [Candidatus Omnitrophota bacterium]
MPEIEIFHESYYDWKCIRMQLGEISLGLTPDIGGRIMSLRQMGKELLFVQEEHRGETFDFKEVGDLKAEKYKLGFRLWGGDKTWVAPEKKWWGKIPPLDLDALPYQVEIFGSRVKMTSPICRETGVRLIRTVELKEGGVIILEQTIVNESSKKVERGIWDVTQCIRPTEVYLPSSPDKIWPYPDAGKIQEAIKKISPYKNWMKIQCNDFTAFKFGAVLTKGVVVAIRRLKDDDQAISFTRFFEIDQETAYAHKVMAEVYNSKDYPYLEVEVHAPMKSLNKGEEFSHRQTWKIARHNIHITPDEVLDFHSVKNS